MIRDLSEVLTICQKHNLPSDYLNPDQSNQEQKFACRLCIDQYYSVIPISLYKESNLRVFEQIEQQYMQNKGVINQLINSLQQLKDGYLKSISNIDGLIKAINYEMELMENEIKQAKDSLFQIDKLKKLHNNYLENQLNLQKKIVQQIEILDENFEIGKLIQSLKNLNISNLNFGELKSPELFKQSSNFHNDFSKQQIITKYEFELLPQSSLKQQQICLAISFNKDASIVVAGCSNQITVFELMNNKLKKIQSLEKHKDFISCLQFMRQSSQFISGSYDQKIIIWHNQNNQWEFSQRLYGHDGKINCLVTNSSENLLISGSQDEKIIFWKCVNNNWKLYQQIQCQSEVYSLSLNDLNTKLISNEKANIISIYELKGNQWMIFQQITTELAGLKIGFLSQNKFVFCKFKSSHLDFYDFDIQSKQFQKFNQVQVNSGDNSYGAFQVSYINSKNLLLVPHCKFINILQGTTEFVLEQQIEFESDWLSGCISDNAQLLLTWDDNSEEFQLRTLKAQNEKY